MVMIRPLTLGDIPDVVALRQRCFTYSAHATHASAERYYREILFESPWYDPELPSLVYEDGSGRITGFVGVLTRRMCLRGDALRVAVPTQMSVAPESRGVAGVQLLTRLFNGPQDLTLCDIANQPMRAIWERLGGVTLATHSLQWTHVVARATWSARQLPGGIVWRAVRRGTTPALRFFDGVIAAKARSRDEAPAGDLIRLPAAPETMVKLVETHAASGIAGCYTPAELSWLFDQLAHKVGPEALRIMAVPNDKGVWRGWYAYVVTPDRTAEVVHIAARRAEYRSVLTHLIEDARTQQLLAVRGRLDPRHAREWTQGAELSADGPWIIGHSRRSELLAALHQHGNFSRLDAEWWLNF